MQHKRWQSSPSDHSVDSIGIGPTNGTVVIELGKDAKLSEIVAMDGLVVAAANISEAEVRLGSLKLDSESEW